MNAEDQIKQYMGHLRAPQYFKGINLGEHNLLFAKQKQNFLLLNFIIDDYLSFGIIILGGSAYD